MEGLGVKSYIKSPSFTGIYNSWANAQINRLILSTNKLKALTAIALTALNIGIYTIFYAVESITRLAICFLTVALICTRFKAIHAHFIESSSYNFNRLTLCFSKGFLKISTASKTFKSPEKPPSINNQAETLPPAETEESSAQETDSLVSRDGLRSPLVYSVPTPSDDEDNDVIAPPPPLRTRPASAILSRATIPNRKPRKLKYRSRARQPLQQDQGFGPYRNR